jgi:hypothetical protein
MPDLPWLDGYSGESVDELIALEGEYRTNSLVLVFEQAMNQKAARVGIGKLTVEERVILAVEALEREVSNGGYDQFFLNTPEYAPVIVDALRRIGCPKTAEITQRALAIVQKSTMSDEEPELRECDALYYEGPELSRKGCLHSSK